MSHLVAPSILSADFLNLGRDVEMLNNSEADWIHVDVMDGEFVPNITFGIPMVQAIKRIAKKPLDVHLMMVDPHRYLSHFIDAGADILNVHYETCNHLNRTINKIKEKGAKAAVTINPHTPVAVLEDILHLLDMVLIMSVNPGYGGQKFIPRTFDKVAKLRKMIDERDNDVLIEVDGGVTLENSKSIVDAGVDVLVTGSTVFKAENPLGVIAEMKNF
ncbi:ribulose-phosphate 3-epimerase [Bacteroidales bacterium]|nr:ribulose-phosphate 3-epimerase [Bacteroidales bacterium]